VSRYDTNPSVRPCACERVTLRHQSKLAEAEGRIAELEQRLAQLRLERESLEGRNSLLEKFLAMKGAAAGAGGPECVSSTRCARLYIVTGPLVKAVICRGPAL
jgi:hypothetical protein